MSLINQMLKDLEARKAENSKAESSSVEEALQSLEPVSVEPRTKWVRIGLGLLFFVSLGIGAWQFYGKEGSPPQNKLEIPAISEPKEAPPPVQATLPPEATPQTSIEDKPIQEAIQTLAAAIPPDEIENPFLKAQAPLAPTKPLPPKSIVKRHPRISKEDQAEEAYQQGLQFTKRQQDQAAIEQFSKSLNFWKQHHSAREALAILQIKRGMKEQAKMRLDEGLILAPTYSSFVKLRARIYVLENRDLEALELLKRHAPPLAQDLEYHAFMAAITNELGQFHEAVLLYRTILEIKPEHSHWRVGLALALEKEGKTEEALAAYQMALKSGGLNAEAIAYVKRRIQALQTLNSNFR